MVLVVGVGFNPLSDSLVGSVRRISSVLTCPPKRGAGISVRLVAYQQRGQLPLSRPQMQSPSSDRLLSHSHHLPNIYYGIAKESISGCPWIDAKMSRICHDTNEVLHGTAGVTTPGLREPTPLQWPCQLSVSLYVPGQDCMTVATSPLARLLLDTEGGAGTERTFGLLRLSFQCVAGWSTSWLWMTRPR